MQTRVEIADFENWRKAAEMAVVELKAGEIVAVPTETVYGLGGDASDTTLPTGEDLA